MRLSYKEPVPQCSAVSKTTKKRCTREASNFHAGKNYCSCHHALVLKEKKDALAKKTVV